MTREEAKKLLPVIKAFTEGKKIETRYDIYDWTETEVLHLESKNEYRIKPESKYRPFKNKDECWQEMLKHQPFGWIKAPDGELFCIDKVYGKGIVYKHSSCRFEEYLENDDTFADGTPFGIRED